MLFRKKISRACSYCQYGTQIDTEQILCIKKGVVPVDGKCRKFCYDPCKRIPVKAKALDTEKFEEYDYSLVEAYKNKYVDFDTNDCSGQLAQWLLGQL